MSVLSVGLHQNGWTTPPMAGCILTLTPHADGLKIQIQASGPGCVCETAVSLHLNTRGQDVCWIDWSIQQTSRWSLPLVMSLGRSGFETSWNVSTDTPGGTVGVLQKEKHYLSQRTKNDIISSLKCYEWWYYWTVMTIYNNDSFNQIKNYLNWKCLALYQRKLCMQTTTTYLWLSCIPQTSIAIYMYSITCARSMFLFIHFPSTEADWLKWLYGQKIRKEAESQEQGLGWWSVSPYSMKMGTDRKNIVRWFLLHASTGFYPETPKWNSTTNDSQRKHLWFLHKVQHAMLHFDRLSI